MSEPDPDESASAPTETDPGQDEIVSQVLDADPVVGIESIPARPFEPRDADTTAPIDDAPRDHDVTAEAPVSIELAPSIETDREPVAAATAPEVTVPNAPSINLRGTDETDRSTSSQVPPVESVEARPDIVVQADTSAPSSMRDAVSESVPEPVIAASEAHTLDEPAIEALESHEPGPEDAIPAALDEQTRERSAEPGVATISEEVIASNRVEIRRPRRPRPSQPSAPEPRASDSLFVESSGDRSPQSWIERLVDVVRQERGQAAELRAEVQARSDVPHIDPIEQVDPPSETTRRFLIPRVGIDPADVPIHRGVQASRIADAHGADAVTAGGEVFVAAGFAEETPEGLGLLAHELTHVARNRQARFVPPIAATPSTPPRRNVVAPRDDGDEESVALGVERRVRAEANAVQRARQIDPLVDIASAPGTSAFATTRSALYRPAVATPVQSATFATEPRQEVTGAANDEWGGLPTPWEPMPDWLAPAMATSFTAAPAPNGAATASSNAPLASMSTPSMATVDSAAPVVQTAPTDRSSDPNETPATASSPGGEEHKGAVEPDLDALARQVYGVLKRRLAAERRRLG